MILTGRISYEKIHQVYRMADCFVCPSQAVQRFRWSLTSAKLSAIYTGKGG
ncbi:MAG: hypothetical protein JWM44_3281 [Bacilli bacterium]|nr:hypothetical protein [Bacilli bacterium]